MLNLIVKGGDYTYCVRGSLFKCESACVYTSVENRVLTFIIDENWEVKLDLGCFLMSRADHGKG